LASRQARHIVLCVNANDLADIEVRALGIQLRVVRPQKGRVDAECSHDAAAGITRDNDVDVGAVGSGGTKAEILANFEVVASIVDRWVQDRELVGRGVVGSADRIAGVATSDSV